MAYLLQQLGNAVPIAGLYGALAFGYAIAFAVTGRPSITLNGTTSIDVRAHALSRERGLPERSTPGP